MKADLINEEMLQNMNSRKKCGRLISVDQKDILM